jgi:hypothetical protein
MTGRGWLLQVVCEGLQDEVFIRRFLKRRGWDAHEFNIRRCGNFNDVSERAASLIHDLRLPGKARMVIVVFDDDGGKRGERINGIHSRVEALAGRRKAVHWERVLYFVPARNIETWLEALAKGRAVDETATYRKREGQEGAIKPEIDVLATACENGEQPAHWPESLKAACVEFEKLKAITSVAGP